MRRAAVLFLAVAALLAVPSGQALASPQAPLAPVHRLDPGAAARAAAAPELDATDRWIVVLKPGEDAGRAEGRARGLGANPDHTFSHAVHGYAAKLDGRQLDSVRRDPAVAMVVADDVFSMQSQSVPTGVERVFGLQSPVTTIDGVDDRVDADVAIVDTGIDRTHPDLNVVGGVNCSTSDRNAWWDSNGHGTHVAGTVGALDNGFGVVGVAPGVRLWAVRILNSAGNGLLSWYVCGLDWITAQRDPQDPSRPLFEAVNMSVAKPGSDDHACGATNGDILHAAICRLVGSGVTVVAAAGNNSFNASRLIPASYDEVITVSALADTDGSPGGAGGNACLSWGGYDKDDTFADFSNYGADVDLIAPGKCILSTLPGNRYGVLSGTSMAAPLVTGAVALYKSSRPLATPDQVKAALEAMGNHDWNTATDPDPYHEPLLDVSKIVAAGDYSLNAAASQGWVQAIDGTVVVPLTVNRAEDFVAPVDLTLTPPTQLAGFTEPTAQLTGAFDPPTLTGLDATSSALTVTVPPGTPPGTYPVVVHATSGGLDHTVQLNVTVGANLLVTRSAGTSRFDTAAAISANDLQPGCPGRLHRDRVQLPRCPRGCRRGGHRSRVRCSWSLPPGPSTPPPPPSSRGSSPPADHRARLNGRGERCGGLGARPVRHHPHRRPLLRAPTGSPPRPPSAPTPSARASASPTSRPRSTSPTPSRVPPPRARSRVRCSWSLPPGPSTPPPPPSSPGSSPPRSSCSAQQAW